MSRAATVLVVGGDDPRAVSAALKAHGIAAVAVEGQDGIQALIDGLRGLGGTEGIGAEEVQDWVLVLDGDLPPELGFEIYQVLHGQHAVPTLTLVRPEKFAELARDPQRSHLDEYATKPVRQDELVLRIQALMLRSGFDLPAAGGDSGVGFAPEGMRSGALVAVMSAKGGVGKTTVAINVADGLVRFHDRKTLVVDGDLWFGDVGVLLNVDSNKSLSDVCFGGDIDILRLQSALVNHDSGFSVLLRPRELWMTESLAASAVVHAMTTYKVLFDYVIVDTDTSVGEVNTQILAAADRILLVTTPEITALHHTGRLLEVAESVGNKNRISLILNRIGSGVPVGAIEAELGVSVAGSLVSAGRSVVAAANRGVTLFAEDPRVRQEITKNMKAIVDFLIEAEGAPPPSGASGGPLPTKRPASRSLFSFLGAKS